MLRVYQCVGIQGDVITLPRLIMRKWKTRLAISKDEKKSISRAIHPLVFAYLKSQHLNDSKNPKETL